MSPSDLLNIINQLKSVLGKVALSLNNPNIDPTIPSAEAARLIPNIPGVNLYLNARPSWNALYAAIIKEIDAFWAEMNQLIAKELKEIEDIFLEHAKDTNPELLKELEKNDSQLEENPDKDNNPTSKM